MLEELRRFWVQQMDAQVERTLLLNTNPIPVVDYKRSRRLPNPVSPSHNASN